MAVNKFNFNPELYHEINDFISELAKNPNSLTKLQVIKLHQLSTKIGFPSRPSGCGACNSRARRNLINYVTQYEKQFDAE